MIFASYSITDKRKESVAFAGPYLIAGQDLLVRARPAGDLQPTVRWKGGKMPAESQGKRGASLPLPIARSGPHRQPVARTL